MATSYTSNKKIGALDSASTPLAATNEIVINQNGDILKTSLSAVEAKVFDAKTATSTPTGTEVVVVRQTDNTLRQVALSDIVPALNITNAKVSASAAINDTKLATINTAGKVTNNAVQAVTTNTANRIVARDGSGNFAAGTITATLSGNASTATNLSSNRTFALTGDVTGSVSSNLSSGASIATAIGSGVIVNADVNNNAGIAHSKLANITAGQVLLGNASNVPTATAVTGDVTISNTGVTAISSGVIVDADINNNAAIAATKLASDSITNTQIKSDAAIAATKLASDSITNTQIKSDAAIAGTKIAPDFGSQNLTTTGFVTTGAASRQVGGNTAQLQSHGTTGARLAATRWTADTNGPILTLFKSRGAAVGTRGAVQSGDTITSMEFYGDDGTNDVIAARILAQVDGTPGTNDMPGRLVFSTTADGSSSPTERMRIQADGKVGIGTSSPGYLLDVTGIVNTSSNYAVDGVQVVGNRRGGWTAPTGTATRATFDSGTVTLSQLAARVHALIDDLAEHGLIDS